MKVVKNHVQLIGNLGTNPEVKDFENGRKMARITLATNESFQSKKGEQVKETQWHSLVAWGKFAQIAEKYLQKGQEVCIEGRLANRVIEDASGMKRMITEVIVNDILLLGKQTA